MFFKVSLPLAVANLMNQAARTVMAIVGPVLAVEFGLSASELGLLAAWMFAAYAAVQLPLGIVLDKFGPRRLQAALMSLTALGFAIFALSPGFAGFAVARIILGVGISAGLMAVIKGNAQWFPPAKVAHVTGLALAVGALGSALTTAPVEALLPVIGWRGVFWVLCAMTLAVVAWILLIMPEKPRSASVPTLREDLAVSARILASRALWRYGPAVATLAMLNFAYLGLWVGPWLRDVAGLDGPQRATLLFVYTLAMLVGNLVMGQWASRAQAAGLPPFLVPVCGLSAMVLIQVGLLFQPSHVAVVAGLWLSLAFCSAVGPAGYIAMGQMFPPEQTGRVSTAVNTMTLLGAFLLQALIGWILDQWPRTASGGWAPDGYSWALAFSAVMQGAAVVALATGWKRSPSRSGVA